jgi:hypothetical protein
MRAEAIHLRSLGRPTSHRDQQIKVPHKKEFLGYKNASFLAPVIARDC